VFPYSDRPGTAAAALCPKVDGRDIRERARQVREIGARMSAAFRARHAGTRRRALVVDDGWSAVTDNYLKVRLDERHERNTWIEAMVGAPEGTPVRSGILEAGLAPSREASADHRSRGGRG
jgi:tRNA A37 methylthiotransferase MiaB